MSAPNHLQGPLHAALAKIRCMSKRIGKLTRQRNELRGALHLGQVNCDAVYDDLRAERDALRAALDEVIEATEIRLVSPADKPVSRFVVVTNLDYVFVPGAYVNEDHDQDYRFQECPAVAAYLRAALRAEAKELAQAKGALL